MSSQFWHYAYLAGAVGCIFMAIKRGVFDDDPLAGLGFCIIGFTQVVASTYVPA